MNRKRKISRWPHLVMLIAATAVLAGCSHQGGGKAVVVTTPGGPSAPASGGGKTLQIAVIPKGSTHEHWKAVHAGAIKAQQELATQGIKINVLWKGPVREDDRNGQIDVVETFLSQQVDGIVLAPLDEEALARPVGEAARQKVPVVIIDSSLNGHDFVSYVATNNEKGGELDGQLMTKLLNGKGRLLMLRYQQGSAATEQREAGFLKVIKQSPGITLVSSDQYSGPTVDTAYKSSQNLLSRYGSQIDAVWTPNESSTRGMRLALKDAGLLKKVKFVGFDISADLIEALKAGEIQGVAVQNPLQMGYMSVKTVVAAIKGQPYEKAIDTGVTLITPENLNDPKLQQIVHPPLEQYLK